MHHLEKLALSKEVMQDDEKRRKYDGAVEKKN